MISQRTKCILKALIVPILIALITLALGIYVITIVLDSYGGYDPNMPSALDTHWTQTTQYQSSSFALAPLLFTAFSLVVVVLGYYWFVRPCLVKEKTEIKL
jgi:ABC-type uncharacterized transport system permease subunit